MSKTDTRQPYIPWRTSDIKYLKEHYATKKTRELEKEMGRSRNSIIHVANKLGLQKDVFSRGNIRGKNIRTLWTPEQEDFLRENFNKMTTSELGRIMERSRYSVYDKAKTLGLKKDPSFFRRKSKKTSNQEVNL